MLHLNKYLVSMAMISLAGIAAYSLGSAQNAIKPVVIGPSEQQLILNGLASGNVLYGPSILQDATNVERVIVDNNPMAAANLMGAVTIYNVGTANGVTIREISSSSSYHVDPGQTLAFPIRLDNNRQVGVKFDAAGADNRIYWVIRSF